MPINHDLQPIELPMVLKFGQEPKTQFHNNLDALKVELVDAPTRQQAWNVAWHYVKATWADRPDIDPTSGVTQRELSKNLEDVFGGAVETLYSNPVNIEEAVSRADLVIGAVLVTGAVAPKLVTEDLLKKMEKGSVVVDVAVDQGGCIETCRPTTHDDPTYEVHGIVHYCVPNMPGAVSQTSTWALTNVTIPYAQRIADRGLVAAAKADPALALGINTYGGHVTYGPVAHGQGVEYVPLDKVLG